MSSRVAKNTVLLITASVAQKIFSFAYFAFIARASHIGVEGTGAYVTALSFSTIFSILTDIGLNPVLVREIAKDRSRAREILSAVLGVKLFAACAAFALLIAVAHAAGYAPAVRELVWFTGIVMALDTVHLTFYGVIRGFEDLRYESVGVVTGQILTVLAGASALALSLPIPYLVGALALGSAWNVAWSAGVLVRKFRIAPAFNFQLSTVKPLILMAIPFALAGGFARIYAQADTLLLGKLAGLHAAGWYSVPYKISFAFQFVPLAFGAALYPSMSNLWATAREKLGPLFVRGMTYLAMIGFPISAGIGVLARPIVLSFFGSRYEPSILPLQILMAALAIGFLDFPPGALLNATGRQGRQTAVMGVTAVVNIMLNLALIPRFGVVGAAISALAGNTILTAGSWILMHRVQQYDARALWLSLGKIAASAGVMGVAVAWIASRIHFAFAIVGGGIIYCGLLFGLRCVTVAEVLNFLRGLRRSPLPAGEDASRFPSP